MESRLIMTMRNAFWSYFSMFVSLVIQFISRTVFIHYLGESYLGINGLFSNVLGVLSFAELGIGTAMNFSLYKPVAEKDIEKIKSYMYYYKWAYRCVAVIIAVLGVALLPFLRYLVKDPGNVGNIVIYYLIYLFNTVSSYFVSYKFSLVNAEQRGYIFTNINLVVSAITSVIQIFILILYKSYLGYLAVAAFLGFVQKIFVSYYLDYLHPYLREKDVIPLLPEERQTLIKKVKALIIHRIGDVSVHQTDNIIVSAFVSVRMVGLLSNYNLIINTVSSCISILFNSVTGSLGNLVATESKEKQYEIFCIYRFIGFWFYGFSSIALLVLSSPFISLWVGSSRVVDDTVITLICIDYYMIGHRVCLNNMKSVGGMFEQDKYIALLQAIINLGASIILVKIVGLPGVYLGTIIQGTLSSVVKPVLVYSDLFGISSRYYFIDSVKYGSIVIIAYAICWVIKQYVIVATVPGFVLMMLIVTVVPNSLFYVVFHKRKEFQYIIQVMKHLAPKRLDYIEENKINE